MSKREVKGLGPRITVANEVIPSITLNALEFKPLNNRLTEIRLSHVARSGVLVGGGSQLCSSLLLVTIIFPDLTQRRGICTTQPITGRKDLEAPSLVEALRHFKTPVSDSESYSQIIQPGLWAMSSTSRLKETAGCQ